MQGSNEQKAASVHLVPCNGNDYATQTRGIAKEEDDQPRAPFLLMPSIAAGRRASGWVDGQAGYELSGDQKRVCELGERKSAASTVIHSLARRPAGRPLECSAFRLQSGISPVDSHDSNVRRGFISTQKKEKKWVEEITRRNYRLLLPGDEYKAGITCRQSGGGGVGRHSWT